MSKGLRYTFLVHAVVAVLGGLVLLIIPGRFLLWVGWEVGRIDPVLSRVLGAALLGLAWSSFRGWRASAWGGLAVVVEAEAIFCVLACIGLLRHLLSGGYPFQVWALFVIFAAFAVAWVFALFQK